MPMAAEEIARLIREAIPDAEVTIRDLAGDGDHYAARVVAASFAGMGRSPTAPASQTDSLRDPPGRT